MSHHKLTRRALLAAAGGGAASMAVLGQDGSNDGNLYGGTMALDEAHNVAGKLWIGPDSAKSEVNPDTSRVFMASDTQVEYYGDGDTWVKLGVGSEEEPVPDVYSDLVNTEDAGITALRQIDIEESSRHQSNKRNLWSTESQTLWVDPDSGVDDDRSNDEVTESNPLATLQEALYRTPQFIQHEWVINLADGTYDETANGPVMFFVGTQPHHPSPFRIIGDEDDPTNVKFTNMMSIQVHQSNELDNASIIGVEMAAGAQNPGGHIKFRDCLITDEGDLQAGLICHNASTTILERVDFTKPVTEGVQVLEGGRVSLKSCDFDVDGYAVNVGNGAIVSLNDSSDLLGGLGGWRIHGGGVLYDPNGMPIHADRPLEDDWGDGKLTNRVNQTGSYRPEWDSEGSPTATDGAAVLDEGDSIETWCPMTTGEWEFQFAAQSTPSSGALKFGPMFTGTADVQCRVRGDDGDVNLSIDDSTEITGSWDVDTDDHRVTIVRSEDIDGDDNAGYELLVDGSSVDTYTTDFLPSWDTYVATWISNDLDVEVHMTRLQQRQEDIDVERSFTE